MVGVVTNNNDPDDMGRVRVKYPRSATDVESAWARVATPSAGNERGLLMLPVVGEEVLVGFEHGDTRRPFVLGSLFNGKDKPGDELLQDQDGSFALRSDEKVLIALQEGLRDQVGGKLIVEIKRTSRRPTGDWTNETTGTGDAQGQQPSTIEGQIGDDQGHSRGDDRGHAIAHAQGRRGRRSSSRSAGVTISGPMINLG